MAAVQVCASDCGSANKSDDGCDREGCEALSVKEGAVGFLARAGCEAPSGAGKDADNANQLDQACCKKILPKGSSVEGGKACRNLAMDCPETLGTSEVGCRGEADLRPVSRRDAQNEAPRCAATTPRQVRQPDGRAACNDCRAPKQRDGCERQLVDLDSGDKVTGLEDACKCCIDGVVRLAVSNPSLLQDVVARVQLGAKMARDDLRACCTMLASIIGCDRLACCLASHDVAAGMSDDTAALAKTPGDRAQTAHIKIKAKFDVAGMDCIDCVSLVERAAKRLESVGAIAVDSVRGVLTLTYDGDRVQPDAIARYIERATGFAITPVDDYEKGGRKIVLPLSFGIKPPIEALHRFGDVTLGSCGVDLALNPKFARRPRDVLAELAAYLPTLRAVARDAAQDRIQREFRDIAVRTAIMTALAIPVLVLAWAKLPAIGKTASQAASTALTTLIWLGAMPIFGRAARELVVSWEPC